ncbi:MAG: serine protein kinase RIO [Candidatus Micrarchaeia archaeon]
MALRRGKKKQPSREDYMLKEQLKIEEGVFDTRTLQRIGKLFSLGIVSRFYFKIATGKESDIYLAEPGDNVKADIVVLKIFRIETTSFRARLDYILGDPRFSSVKKDMHAIVEVWCKKEYGNLKIAQSARINAPIPYDFSGNVLAMSFIGHNGVPAPQLRNANIENPEAVLDKIIDQAKKLYEAGLVHADLSEYNILIKDGEPYFIDFGQAVMTEHPASGEFLKRDLHNVLDFFSKKYGISRSEENVFKFVTSSSF